MEKSACIGAMANGIATERRCVVGSILSHFLPVVYWLGCIIFTLFTYCIVPRLLCAHLWGRKVGVICF